MTRAVRPDKLTLAALHAVLRLYTNPARLAEELPTLRLLTRDVTEIEQLAISLAPIVQGYCEDFQVTVDRTHSQVGSGALPIDRLESAALKFTQPDKRRPGKALKILARAFRELPVPVIGRIANDALWFDLRCLEDEAEFVDNLRGLAIS
jgi:L-seryl-tRNA(Ser) seleniumtransferase